MHSLKTFDSIKYSKQIFIQLSSFIWHLSRVIMKGMPLFVQTGVEWEHREGEDTVLPYLFAVEIFTKVQNVLGRCLIFAPLKKRLKYCFERIL